MTLALLCIPLVVSWLGTMLIERQAWRLGLVQPPNARSSHTTPTPRGGGLAIAVAIVLTAVVMALAGAEGLWPIAGLTAVAAALGFADDLRDLSPALRFSIHIGIILALIWANGPMTAMPMPFGPALDGWLLTAALLLLGLWWLNLFNFMDGIDGIAASQAILILVGSSAIWWSVDPAAPSSPVLWLSIAGAAATAGFLLRNWPPARIFMGDAGSNALAVLVYAVALSTMATDQLAGPTWLILPAVFVTDATVTLVRRAARGERPWQAHRLHAYQQLSRRWGHLKVTLLYGGITLFGCIPLAALAQYQQAWGWGLVPLIYLPLTVLAVSAGAGRPE